jgi:phosphohistidine phosphatase
VKTLILMRHAHALNGDHDYARPLSERGQKQAEVVAVDFKELGLLPDRIVCSGAQRTRRTAEIVAALLGFPGEIDKEDKLYEASMMDCFRAIQLTPESVDTLLLIGHNPSLSELVSAVQHSEVELPPAGFEILRRPSWLEFKP